MEEVFLVCKKTFSVDLYTCCCQIQGPLGNVGHICENNSSNQLTAACA